MEPFAGGITADEVLALPTVDGLLWSDPAEDKFGLHLLLQIIAVAPNGDRLVRVLPAMLDDDQNHKVILDVKKADVHLDSHIPMQGTNPEDDSNEHFMKAVTTVLFRHPSNRDFWGSFTFSGTVPVLHIPNNMSQTVIAEFIANANRLETMPKNTKCCLACGSLEDGVVWNRLGSYNGTCDADHRAACQGQGDPNNWTIILARVCSASPRCRIRAAQIMQDWLRTKLGIDDGNYREQECTNPNCPSGEELLPVPQCCQKCTVTRYCTKKCKKADKSFHDRVCVRARLGTTPPVDLPAVLIQLPGMVDYEDIANHGFVGGFPILSNP